MKRNVWILAGLLWFALVLPVLVLGQDTRVAAEAIGQANLRAAPDVNAVLVGEIFAGTRYPVIGQSEFYPWVLLGDPATYQPIGWVFRDLVTISGNLDQVPFSTVDISALIGTAPGSPSATPGVVNPPSNPNVTPGAAAAGGNSGVNGSAGPTLTPISSNFAVTGAVNGEVNIRYGPGVDFPPVGRAFAGDRLEITAYHTQFPWVQVRYPASPNGFAWIAVNLLEITGDLYSLPAITTISFNLPTLTPTPSVLQSSNPLGEPVSISPQFAALGERIWNQVLEAGFVPESRRFGALYIQNLQTGEAITFGSEFAFSGTSINKIAILVEFFGFLNGTPSLNEAIDIANTMICSENVATNRLLGVIGNGDQILGAENTTLFLQQLGLSRTYLTAPFDTRPSPDVQPTQPPRPVRVLDTDADQEKANPNPTNQMTVEEMGWLLSSVYRCAYEEGGPLINQFDGRFTPQECRKILHVMSSNTVDALLKAGVPADIRVAHKHGWVEDTHGNAAVFFTPGGDYIIVMMLFEPEFLQFTASLPVIANASREVFNFFNPGAPMEVVREGYIPTTAECNYTAEDQVVLDLASPYFAETLEPSMFYNPTATPDVG